MPPIDFSEDLDIEIRLNERFNDIHSLGYALIDLQAITSATAYITAHKDFKGKKLPTTVRTFGKKYKDELKLKKFEQGSFIATVATGVITGVILKFLDKYFDNDAVREVHNHFYLHTTPIQVRFEDQQFEESINTILNDVEVIPDNIELSLENAIQAINDSELLGEQQIVYTEEGLAVLAQDINRLGMSLNIRA